MYGKALTQMIRICGMISCLEHSFEIVTNMESTNKHILCIELDNCIEKEYLKESKERYCITIENLKAAKDLVEYFILNRLILAGYASKLNYDTVSDNITSILKNIRDRDSSVNCKLLKLILMQEGEIIECKELVRNKKGGKDCTSESFVNAFKELQSAGIGTYEEKINPHGPTSKSFRKFKITEDTPNKIELIQFLEFIEIDVSTYMQQFNKISKINYNLISKLKFIKYFAFFYRN